MSGLHGILSICRRAGKVVGGMDEVKASVAKGNAKIVLCASDISDNSRREIAFRCDKYGVKIYDVPETMSEISDAVGKRFGILAIEDKGFSEAIVKRLLDN